MDRRERAVVYQRKTTPEILLTASSIEAQVAKILKGRVTTNTAPFDVIVDELFMAVEVKTLCVSENAGQIFMNRLAKERKICYATSRQMQMVTVVVDLRAGQKTFYVRSGIGCFRLRNMQRVVRPRDLRSCLRKLCSEAGLQNSPAISH
jgi:hypothetical protein